MNIRLIAVAATALLGVAACSSTSTELAFAPGVDVAAAPPIDTPVPGAVTAYGSGGLNSDNQPAVTRTGLNSDPANPSGVAGRQIGSEYD